MSTTRYQIQTTDDHQFLESLSRIAAGLSSSQELEAVLANLVTAVCDHTAWQLCWIVAADLERGTATVVARRDRLHYSEGGTRLVWDLEYTPAFEAIARNESIEIVDAQNTVEFPDYRDDARLRGYTCGLVQPLDVEDAAGHPMVLSVQSTTKLLPSDSQRAFLQTVAHLAAVAVKNSIDRTRERRRFLDLAQASATQARVLEMGLSGAPIHEAFDKIQQECPYTMVVFGQSGTQLYPGNSPDPAIWDQGDWEEGSERLLAETVAEHLSGLVSDTWKRVSPEGSAIQLEVKTEDIGAESQRLGILVLVRVAATQAYTDWSISPLTLSTLALVLIRDHLKHQVADEFRIGVLRQLITGEWTHRADMLSSIGSIGIAPEESVGLAVLELEQGDAVPGDRLLRAVDAAVRPHSLAGVFQIEQSTLLLFDNATDEVRLRESLASLVDRLSQSYRQKLILAFGGICTDLDDYPSAWRTATTGIKVARQLEQCGFVGDSEFGVYRFLLAATERRDMNEFVEKTLGALIEYDAENDGDLVDTIEAFCLSGGKYQEAARQLHIHVSTLRYRLNKVEDILGAPLDDDARFELAVATRLERLRSG